MATIGAWAGWGVGAIALAVTGLVTLTTVRAVVPIAVVVAGVAAVAGAPAGSVLALGVPAAVAAVLVAAADTGHVYMQASAYGDERRFGLRPPLGYLVPTVASWVVWTAALLAAPLAWAAGGWVLAAVSTVVARRRLPRPAPPLAPAVAALARHRAGRPRRPRPGRARRHADDAEPPDHRRRARR